MRRLAIIGLLGGLLVVAPSTTWSQSEPTIPEPEVPGEKPTTTEQTTRTNIELRRTLPSVVQAGPVDPRTYVLGPGDLLQVDLWGKLVRTVPLEVSPEGKIFLPGSGPMQVSGRTLAWARERILSVVAETFRGVRAEVRLLRLRTFMVYVTGFVSHPGPYEATSVSHASEAVSRAELGKNGSRRRITIRHVDGSRSNLDLELFESLGRQDLDPTVIDGDVISVPRATEFVETDGAVGKPGKLELGAQDSLHTLVQLAGGTLPSAIRDRSLLVRFASAAQRESVWVDLDHVAKGEQDLPLRDGDHLFVPFRSAYHLLPTVKIEGEVEHPGTFPIVLGQDRFSNLIRWSGGFRPQANRAAIHLVRENGSETQNETQTVAQKDPEFDRLARLPRSGMTESEYTKFQTKLAEQKNAFLIDWASIQKGTSDVDPLLQDGDVVRVDRLVPTVRVEGEVRRPGFVDFVPGRSLREYVDLSGGFTDRASKSTIRVSRSLTGQVIPAKSVKSIQPGDFIWVPERRDVDAWGVVRDVVAVASQVAVLVFTLSR